MAANHPPSWRRSRCERVGSPLAARQGPLPVAAVLFGTLLLLTSACGGGCAAVGAVAYKFSPPPTIPAQYTPEHEPTVVFVQPFSEQTFRAVDLI